MHCGAGAVSVKRISVVCGVPVGGCGPGRGRSRECCVGSCEFCRCGDGGRCAKAGRNCCCYHGCSAIEVVALRLAPGPLSVCGGRCGHIHMGERGRAVTGSLRRVLSGRRTGPAHRWAAGAGPARLRRGEGCLGGFLRRWRRSVGRRGAPTYPDAGRAHERDTRRRAARRVGWHGCRYCTRCLRTSRPRPCRYPHRAVLQQPVAARRRCCC